MVPNLDTSSFRGADSSLHCMADVLDKRNESIDKLSEEV